MDYLEKAIKLDPNYKAGRNRAEESKEKLRKYKLPLTEKMVFLLANASYGPLAGGYTVPPKTSVGIITMSIMLQKYNVIAVFIFVGAIFVAHLLSIGGYNWKVNTVSELASQGYSRKWIMQIGFIAFGLILLAGIGYKIKLGKIDYFIDIPIGIYGLAILISGIYCTKPFIDGLEYSDFESKIHSISATVAGIAFSIGLLASGIKEPNHSMRLIHFVFLIFVMGMSAYFGISQSNNGLIQKLMYLGSFYWLIKYYNYELV